MTVEEKTLYTVRHQNTVVETDDRDLAAELSRLLIHFDGKYYISQIVGAEEEFTLFQRMREDGISRNVFCTDTLEDIVVYLRGAEAWDQSWIR